MPVGVDSPFPTPPRKGATGADLPHKRIDSAWGLARKCASLAGRGRLGDALGYCSRSLATTSAVHNELIIRARSPAAKNHQKEAVTYYGRCANVTFESPCVMARPGKALAALGRHKEAVNRHTKALALKPGDIYMLAVRAKSLDTLGPWGQAAAEIPDPCAFCTAWHGRRGPGAAARLPLRDDALDGPVYHNLANVHRVLCGPADVLEDQLYYCGISAAHRN